MHKMIERRQGITMAIFSLWRNWVVSIGILTLLTMLAPLVPRMWLAPVNIILYLALDWSRKHFRKGAVPVCSRLNRQVSFILLVTAAALVIINILESHGTHSELNGQPWLATSPLLSILLTAPLTCLVTLSFLLRKGEPQVCRRCALRYGNVIEHGFIGDFYRREWRYQTRMLFWLSFFLSVADWWYYLRHYVNINFNRADMFFFVWMPLMIYAATLIYLGIRYFSLWTYYCKNDEQNIISTPGTSRLRFLIITGDKMLIDFYPTDKIFANGAKVKRFDTPAVIDTPYHTTNNLHEAIRRFQQKSGIMDAEIKPAYESPDTVTFSNIFHYFAFVKNTEVLADSKLHGEWLGWGHLLQMASEGILDRDLVAELKRIYEVVMARKTYDSSGHRLYQIRHYKPTFRLSDLKNWDEDCCGMKWLSIFNHNEDKARWRIADRLGLHHFNKRTSGCN